MYVVNNHEPSADLWNVEAIEAYVANISEVSALARNTPTRLLSTEGADYRCRPYVPVRARANLRMVLALLRLDSCCSLA